VFFYDSSNWKNAILEQSVELRQLIIRQTATITITSQENNNNIVFVECVCHYNNVKSVRRKRKKNCFEKKRVNWKFKNVENATFCRHFVAHFSDVRVRSLSSSVFVFGLWSSGRLFASQPSTHSNGSAQKLRHTVSKNVTNTLAVHKWRHIDEMRIDFEAILLHEVKS